MLLPFVAALGTGCSGINASHSVSPASFFLPGLIRHEACTNLPAIFPATQFASLK